MQKSFVLSPNSPQLSVRHDESGSAFTSRMLLPASHSDRLINLSQQKSPASSSMRKGMEFTQLDKVVVVEEQDICGSYLSNEGQKKDHPCKQISDIEQDYEIQSQGGSGMFFYNQDQQKQEEDEINTEKEEKKWNKQEKFFKRMLENNTIMLSAKKERQVQQDNVKQFLSQENRFLQTVFGNQYLPTTTNMNQDSQASNFVGTTQQNIQGSLMNNSNNSNIVLNSQGELVKQLKLNSKDSQYKNGRVNKIERKGRIFTFQQANNNPNNTIIESQNQSKDKGVGHASSSQQSLSSSSSYGQQQKQYQNQGRSQKSTAYGLLGIQKSRVQAKVIQFIRKCQIKSGLKNISLLNDHRIAVINDLAFSSIENQHPFTKKPSILQSLNLTAAFNRQIHQFCLFIGSYFLAIPVLDPSSSVKQLLDLLILIFNLVSIFFLPVDRFILAFTEQSGFSYNLLYQILTGLAIADILSRFLTGIYLQGEIILDRTQIARQYLKTHFVLDTLSSLPLIFRSFSQSTSELWDILIFLKIYRVSMIMDQQFELQIIRNNSGHLVSFVKVILLDLTIIHLLTSLLLLLGFKETTNGWIHSQGQQNQHWFLLYTQTFYLLLQLHLTNGQQNIIIISSENEFWFMSAASVILFSMLMYNLKKITRILHDYKKHDKEITKKMLLVNVYLRQKNIDQRLKVKVVKYLQFQLLQKEQLSHQSEQTIIAQLSQNLREQVLIQSNIWFIQQSHILRRFSLSVQEKASTYLETLILNANEIIFEAGEQSEDPYYYFLSKGSVEFFVESSKGAQQINRLNLLSSGKWFGEVSFLTSQERLVGARAKERSVVCRISRVAFLRAIGNQRTEYETFKVLEEKIKLQDLSSLKLSCWSCCSMEHSIKFCPLLHFIPDVEAIILREIFSLPQRRVKIYPRKCYPKMLGFSQPKQIQAIQQQFRYENGDLLENYAKKFNLFVIEESGNPFISKNYESITDPQEQIGYVRDSMKPRKVVSQYIIPSNNLQHHTHLAESEIIQTKNASQQQSSKNQLDSQELKLCDTSKSEERTVMSLLSKLQIKAPPPSQQQFSQSNLEKEKGQTTPNIQGQLTQIRNTNYGLNKLTISQSGQASLVQKGGSKSKTTTSAVQTLPSRKKQLKSNSPFCHSLTEGFDSSNKYQNHCNSHSVENCQFPSQDWVVNTITSNDKIFHRQEEDSSQVHHERVHTLDMYPLTSSHLHSQLDIKLAGLKQFSKSGKIPKRNEQHGVYSFFDRNSSKSQTQHMYSSRSQEREMPNSQVNSLNNRDKQ